MQFYTNVTRWGDTIYYRGYEDGRQVLEKIKFEPTFYMRAKGDSSYKSLDGVPLMEHNPGSIKECNDFIEKFKDVENFTVYGNDNYPIQYIAKKFTKKVIYNLDNITIYTIDIETAKNIVTGYSEAKDATEPITLITVRDSYTKRIITFGCKEYTPTNELVKYVQCKDETDLLVKFIEFLSKRYPDVITGWNVDNYDVTYISKRIENVLGEEAQKRLSPWGIVRKKTSKISAYGDEVVTYDIKGIEILDYLDLYKKFSFTPREEYKLDFIGEVELGEKKVDYSDYDDLEDLSQRNWKLFVDYNIQDTVLVSKLEDKMKLIALIITMAYEAKCNYSDVFSPVGMWDSIIYNHLLSKNIIVPMKRFGAKAESFEGGYVETPIIGMHEWVVTFDASSLYPSIMVAYNISPETFVGIDRNVTPEAILNDKVLLDTTVTTCANGAMFSRDKQGFVGELVEYFLDYRKKAKNEMIKKEKELEEVKKEILRRGL